MVIIGQKSAIYCKGANKEWSEAIVCEKYENREHNCKQLAFENPWYTVNEEVRNFFSF